jgi:hypothetical protein
MRLCWYVTTVAKSFPLPTLPFLTSLEGILSDLQNAADQNPKPETLNLKP